MEFERSHRCFFCKISMETPFLIHSYLCKSYNYYELYDKKLLNKNRQYILQMFNKYKGGYSEYRLEFSDKKCSVLKKYFSIDDTYEIATNTFRKCSFAGHKIIMHYGSQFYMLLKKNQVEKQKNMQQFMKGHIKNNERGEKQKIKKFASILSGINSNKNNSSQQQLKMICSKIGENNKKMGSQKDRIKFSLFQEFQKMNKKLNKLELKKQINFKRSLQSKVSQILNKEDFLINEYNPEKQSENMYGLVPKYKTKKNSSKKLSQKKRFSTEPTNTNTLSLKLQKVEMEITKPSNMKASSQKKRKNSKLHRSKSADKNVVKSLEKNVNGKISESRYRQYFIKK